MSDDRVAKSLVVSIGLNDDDRPLLAACACRVREAGIDDVSTFNVHEIPRGK